MSDSLWRCPYLVDPRRSTVWVRGEFQREKLRTFIRLFEQKIDAWQNLPLVRFTFQKVYRCRVSRPCSSSWRGAHVTWRARRRPASAHAYSVCSARGGTAPSFQRQRHPCAAQSHYCRHTSTSNAEIWIFRKTKGVPTSVDGPIGALTLPLEKTKLCKRMAVNFLTEHARHERWYPSLTSSYRLEIDDKKTHTRDQI